MGANRGEKLETVWPGFLDSLLCLPNSAVTTQDGRASDVSATRHVGSDQGPGLGIGAGGTRGLHLPGRGPAVPTVR